MLSLIVFATIFSLIGFFRVNYDLNNWNLLIGQLLENTSGISINNRAQLIDDAFELAENCLLEYDIPIKLIKYLPNNEINYTPWATALSNLELLETTLHNTKFNGMYQVSNSKSIFMGVNI